MARNKNNYWLRETVSKKPHPSFLWSINKIVIDFFFTICIFHWTGIDNVFVNPPSDGFFSWNKKNVRSQWIPEFSLSILSINPGIRWGQHPFFLFHHIRPSMFFFLRLSDFCLIFYTIFFSSNKQKKTTTLQYLELHVFSGKKNYETIWQDGAVLQVKFKNDDYICTLDPISIFMDHGHVLTGSSYTYSTRASW